MGGSSKVLSITLTPLITTRKGGTNQASFSAALVRSRCGRAHRDTSRDSWRSRRDHVWPYGRGQANLAVAIWSRRPTLRDRKHPALARSSQSRGPKEEGGRDGHASFMGRTRACVDLDLVGRTRDGDSF